MIHTRATYNVTDAPRVALFSSRGPQTISLNILKPEISAPGLFILAAFTQLAAPKKLSTSYQELPCPLLVLLPPLISCRHQTCSHDNCYASRFSGYNRIITYSCSQAGGVAFLMLNICKISLFYVSAKPFK